MPPMSELKHDMELLKKSGFTLIKLQEHWSADEPEEGRYDFSKYEDLIGFAQNLDLDVYLGLTCEQAPHWLFNKYPDCRMVGADGVPVAYEATMTLPADGKPGPCFDHPGALEAQKRFITALVKTLGPYKNLTVWNTWQEIAYWPRMTVGQDVCFCENTLSFFRSWLRDTYGSLEELNRQWNVKYVHWDSVVPDRRLIGKTCAPVDVDWRYFMENVQIGKVLTGRADAIRAADPLHRPVFAHKGSPIIGSGVDWTYARSQDFLGSSCYPAWHAVQEWDDLNPKDGRPFDRAGCLLAEMWDAIALRFDYIRSANKKDAPIWAAEFQGGPVSTNLHRGRIPSEDDIRRWMLTAVGSGITALSFWVTRAEIAAAETNGFSLLDSAGDDTPRFREAARVGAALSAHPGLFAAPTLEPASAAILIDEWNYQLCDSMDGAREQLVYSARGWYRILWELGIPVEFVDIHRLHECEMTDYTLAVLPFPLSISEKIVEDLSAFVNAGGSLVSEACIGRLDPHGYARRGELSERARDLFGANHNGIRMVREPEDQPRWMPKERGWGEFAEAAYLEGTGEFEGDRIRANFYIETFTCTTADPIALYGDAVAGVINQVGSGRAALIGTLVGHGGTAYRDERGILTVAKLLHSLGARPSHEGRLLVRRRVADSSEAWIVTNPTNEILRESFDVGGFSAVRDLLNGTVELAGNTVSLSVAPLDVRLIKMDR